jgi:hypothetical protein
VKAFCLISFVKCGNYSRMERRKSGSLPCAKNSPAML